MPYKTEWVNSEVFFKHNGVKIYRVYKNDDFKTPLHFWFTTDSSKIPEIDFTFDVRDLIPEYIKLSFEKIGQKEFAQGIQDGAMMREDMIKIILKHAFENKKVEIHPNNQGE